MMDGASRLHPPPRGTRQRLAPEAAGLVVDDVLLAEERLVLLTDGRRVARCLAVRPVGFGLDAVGGAALARCDEGVEPAAHRFGSQHGRVVTRRACRRSSAARSL